MSLSEQHTFVSLYFMLRLNILKHFHGYSYPSFAGTKETATFGISMMEVRLF